MEKFNTPDLRERLGINLNGYAASSGGKRRNVHFADAEGYVVCKTKGRFGFDCHTIVLLVSIDDYYTDNSPSGEFWKNHLPLSSVISCKKCLKKIEATLKTSAMNTPENIQLPQPGEQVLRDGYPFRVTQVIPHRDSNIVATITLRGEAGEVEVGYFDYIKHKEA